MVRPYVRPGGPRGDTAPSRSSGTRGWLESLDRLERAAPNWRENVAFRLSGLAARDGAPAILASSELIEALTEPLPSRTWPSLTVKGRSAPVMVAGLG
jgi:hypothetical protein